MSKIVKKKFIIEGLDCASCAIKIENKLNKINGITEASMNFATGHLKIKVQRDGDYGELAPAIYQAINMIEPKAKIIEKKSAYSGGYNHNHNDSYGHSHGHDHSEGLNKSKLIIISIGSLLFFTALVFSLPFQIKISLYLLGYLMVGGQVILRAIRNIAKGQVFDENFLMSLATIGAFAIGEYPEGVAVMLFYQVGELFQGMAVNRSRRSIASLMDIKPDYANLKKGDDILKVSPEEVFRGDVIIVRPGEKVPLDGIVIEGGSTLDTSSLTGESLPKEVGTGDAVMSGSINNNGLLTVKVTNEFDESTVSKILDLIENASSKKAPTENFITKFARYYTPIVVFASLALAIIPPLFIPGARFDQWIHKALIFLVISCPCALVISIPLGFFGGIGGASKKGILIKGSNYLEALNDVDIAVFDKTGTLTKGVFIVTNILNRGIFSKEGILEYAAYAESNSNHPIALSILSAYGKGIDKGRISGYEEIPGHGIRIELNGKLVLAGNKRLMKKEQVAYEEFPNAGTLVHIAVDGEYAGAIEISDEIREDSLKAVGQLRAMGVKKLVMLTGDSKIVGEKIADELGLDCVYAELLPHQKVEKLEMLEKARGPKGKLLFVGDGINDAPVLARADVGVAMGGLGSDAAIEAADIVLMTDEPSKIANAIKIAKRTRRIVWQNIVMAMVVKALVLLLGAGGIATMWEAVFADVGVALLAIFNAMRVLRVPVDD